MIPVALIDDNRLLREGLSGLLGQTPLLRAELRRIRTLAVLKSRGMPHSNQVREFVLTDQGLKLLEVVRHEGRVLIGSEPEAYASEAAVAAQRTGKRSPRR